jgi:hypothetical protein
MKIKQLFCNSVRGTSMFRALVDIHGLRNAIKEVNKVYRDPACVDATCRLKNVRKSVCLCIWVDSPQGLDFWLEVNNVAIYRR